MRFQKRTFKEEYAIVLDYLPHGDPLKGIREPIVYALGKEYFLLLSLIPKPNTKIEILEEVYIGDGPRPKIKTVLQRIKYNDLPPLAKDNLPKAIEKIVKEKEQKFVEFFNKAGPINVRVHSLELLPGIGKTTLNSILEQREIEKFKSFEDIKNRVKGIKDPINILVERILEEIKGEEKYRLFVPI